MSDTARYRISANNLLLSGNNISRTLLQHCGDLGHLTSPASYLRPTGPYIWLFRQFQLSRDWINSVASNIFEMNSSCMFPKVIPMASQNAAELNRPFVTHKYRLSIYGFIITSDRFHIIESCFKL